MKIAAIVIAHQEPELINILVRQLKKELQCDVYLHVSKGNEGILDQVEVTSGVEIVPFHINSGWATNRLMDMILRTASYAQKKGSYDYYLVLSGQDLLVRKGLKDKLEAAPDRIYMTSFESDAAMGARIRYKWPKIFFKNYKYRWHPARIVRRGMLELYKKKFPLFKQKNSKLLADVTLYKNHFWMGLPADALEYLCRYYRENKEIVELYRKAIGPEDIYFSTVLRNSPEFAERFEYRDAEHKKSRSLTFHGRFRNNESPVMRMSDVERIEKSTKSFFARKFSMVVDEEVVCYFEKKILED